MPKQLRVRLDGGQIRQVPEVLTMEHGTPYITVFVGQIGERYVIYLEPSDDPRCDYVEYQRKPYRSWKRGQG